VIQGILLWAMEGGFQPPFSFAEGWGEAKVAKVIEMIYDNCLYQEQEPTLR
jgi:hypothetical protein